MDKGTGLSILSVNKDFESYIKSDRGFLFSHFSNKLARLTPFEVSGMMLEPALIGQGFDFFESSINRSVINNLLEVASCLDYFFEDDSYLRSTESLQTVLEVETIGIKRPIVGLNSLIVLKGLAEINAKGNVVSPVFEFNDDDYELSSLVNCPSYLSFVNYNFCSSMQDASTFTDSDVTEDKICMYIPLVVVPTGDTDKSKALSVNQSGWFNKIIRHFSQGHYQLITACDQAKKHPYSFCLLLASILGVDYRLFAEHKTNDRYPRLTDSQKIDFIRAVKPLVESVSFEFMSGDLVSL